MHVYILYSEKLNLHYTGVSRYHAKRTRQHLRGKSPWTSRADDWKVKWTTEVADMAAARQLERRIKARGAGRFLEEVAVVTPRDAG